MTSSSINDAAARLRSDNFDLLVVDLRMPEGNGTDLIKKFEDLSHKPKGIVCSAYVSP